MTCHKVLGIVSLVLTVVYLGCSTDAHDRINIVTEQGSIEVEIYTDRAPVTATNFLALVREDVFTDALFYRVVRLDNQPQSPVKIEVIQGGLYRDDRIDRFEAIAHETTHTTGIKHLDGVISMARNEPGTASTEFFICIGDQPSLDFGGKRNPDGQGFAAFGKVVEGMNVARAIQSLPDDGQYLTDQVRIRKISRIR